LHEVAQRGHDGGHLLPCHPALSGGGSDLSPGCYFLGLGLGDPQADDGGVSPSVEARPVRGDLLVEVGDPRLGRFGEGSGVVGSGRCLIGELVQLRAEALATKRSREPFRV